MTQDELFAPLTSHQLDQLSQTEMRKFVEAQARVISDLSRHLQMLRDRDEKLRQMSLQIDEEFITIKGEILPQNTPVKEEPKAAKHKNKKKKLQLPSERYPQAELIEQEIGFRDTPHCSCCNHQMSFSGLYEICEYLSVTPAVFRVIRQKRQKYRCPSCHGEIKTVPPMPRICPGSAYSDEMIIDVAIAKYCDLIPIERYAQMAGRSGLIDLPPNSLIQLTHYLADFVSPIYERIKEEVLLNRVLHADETPHRMLEGGGLTKNGHLKQWYLWGFSDNKGSSYFEVRNTRSGDVASELLKDSSCEFLVSDVYSGYSKSVKETNKLRETQGKATISNVYCNAHALRKFKELATQELQDILQLYQKIYRLERIGQKWQRTNRARRLMLPLFSKIKTKCLERLSQYSNKSSESKAMKYFLKNYEALTLFTKHEQVPIDNNPQERQMRSPVIGRKTWYGNHSLKGARTTAILFSIIESCKLANVNPREYFRDLVQSKLLKQPIKTPKEFASEA